MPPEVTNDRRVRRTRALLEAALVELILERGYDHLTVQDILDQADIGRSTFYNHYQSKDDLFLSRVHALEAAVEARIATAVHHADEDPEASLMAPLRPLFEHAQDHRDLCLALHTGGRATETASRLGRTMLRDTLTTYLRSRLVVADQDSLDLAVTFVIDGLFGVITQWLENQPHRSMESVFADFDQAATRGVSAYLH